VLQWPRYFGIAIKAEFEGLTGTSSNFLNTQKCVQLKKEHTVRTFFKQDTIATITQSTIPERVAIAG
jgi:hypothetical protein